MNVTAVVSPNKPRPSQPDTRWLADTLRRIEINYAREGSGPGSRFEGRLLEDVQSETLLLLISRKLLDLPPERRMWVLRDLANPVRPS